MTRAVAAGAILFYQRHLSPRKGYGCPRRVLCGRMSCAEFARRAVLRVGPARGIALLRRRLAQCAASRRAASQSAGGEEGAAQPAEPRPLDYAGPHASPPAPQLPRRRGGRWWSAGSRGACSDEAIVGELCTGAGTCCCSAW